MMMSLELYDYLVVELFFVNKVLKLQQNKNILTDVFGNRWSNTAQ
jgi:hypothetical protein